MIKLNLWLSIYFEIYIPYMRDVPQMCACHPVLDCIKNN